MLKTGLVSVTYRPLPPRKIVRLCRDAQLEGIEWGGDVHVPPGDLENAREVARLTRDAGLQVACYGSYYRCEGAASNPASDPAPGDAFEPVLETALALGAPLIRVWAGQKGSAECDADEFARVADDLRRISAMAQAAGIAIATEYHGGTLTDTRQSCAQLHNAAAHPNLATLWQPLRRGLENPLTAENAGDLRAVLPYLSNIHVYHWVETATGRQSRPLAEDTAWPTYVEILRAQQSALPSETRWLLLEFVPGGAPEVLGAEAAALHALLAN